MTTHESTPGGQVSRRTFIATTALGTAAGAGLTGVGGTAVGNAVGEGVAAAASSGTGPYALSNGYLDLAGSYGKLTTVAVDPTGKGDYAPMFLAAFVGHEDLFDAAHNAGVTWTVTGSTLTLSNLRLGDGATAAWTLTLDGSTLGSAYEIHAAAGETVSDPGLTTTVPWRRDGYSVAAEDGVSFSRFYTDAGQYMPAQQLKRRPSWGTFGLTTTSSIHATGTGSYDLTIAGTDIGISGGSPIQTDRMPLQITGSGPSTATLRRTHAIAISPHATGADTLPAIFPVFTASDVGRARQLTTLFHERTLSGQPGAGATNGGDWKDWTGRMYDWMPNSFSRGEGESLLGIRLDDDGYVWTWNPNGARDWPFPDPNVWDTRHFVTNAMYVLGTWRYFSWTGDEAFLATMLPRVRKAMAYQMETLGGKDGLVVEPGPDHTGIPQGIGSNYWDITPFGHLDAYTNAYFYGSLEAAAQLEAYAGDAARADELRALRPKVKALYGKTFWDDRAGRFIECVDAEGTRHDYGSAFVNLEAMSFDLATATQVRRVYAWLEQGATELTEPIVMVDSASGSTRPVTGHTVGQSFTASASFAQVGAAIAAASTDNAGLKLTLSAGGPGGKVLASKAFSAWRWPGGWAHLDVPTQPAGTYYLELSATDGSIAWANGGPYADGKPYADGSVDTSVQSRAVAAISPYRQGPSDIYSRFGWAPRATTRKNNFWYFWGWAGLTVPWEQQLQDGGTDLYLSGFDVLVRARYLSADNAWRRLTAVLDRWADPDHLCGGDPLFRGEHPQNESTPGSVGVDIPFPESGLAPGSFLPAFVGVEAEPDALVVTPNLPGALDSAGVRNLLWRGRSVEVSVTRSRIRVDGPGVHLSRSYRPGQSVRLPAPPRPS